MRDLDALIDACRRGQYSPTRDDVVALGEEIERLTNALAAADKALIDARDTLCMGDDDDGYWRWFNRHEDAVFRRLVQPSHSEVPHDADQ
jgi:hypothetical protein